MNRHFFADDDPEGLKVRLTEVELVRSYLKDKVPKDERGNNMLKMFLDIHAHSACNSIFCYCPWVDEPAGQSQIKRFPMILDNMSAFFQFDNCKFGNERYKKNCARLSVHRDFNLNASYTIESSCYAYEIKGTDDVEQFKEYHFLKFGEHLAFGIAKNLNCEVGEMDMAGMSYGFDIDLDYGLYMKDSKENKKAKRRRHRDLEKLSKRKRTTSNMGMRESKDSFRGSATSGFGGKGYLREKESRNDNRIDKDKYLDSRQSNKRGVNLNKAHISQTKFELNPPGLDQGSFTSVNNGVVLIMNQSQRDYYRAQG